MHCYKFDSAGNLLPPIIVAPECPEGYVMFGDGSAVDLTKYEFVNCQPVARTPVALPAPFVPTLDQVKAQKLSQIDMWTSQAITGGFWSSVTGTKATYDSTPLDQQTLQLMYIASQSPNFASDPTYKGQIPIRAIPAGQAVKVVLQHNSAQMQQLMADMAIHIGSCKQKGWSLQSIVNNAASVDVVNAVTWS